MSNLRRGRAKVEFYKHIKQIREAYRAGYVVYKVLYEKMKKELNLQMSYYTFLRYAKKEFDTNFNEKEVGKKSGQVNTKIDSSANQSEDPDDKKEDLLDDAAKESMEEYLKNMSHIFEAKKQNKRSQK